MLYLTTCFTETWVKQKFGAVRDYRNAWSKNFGLMRFLTFQLPRDVCSCFGMADFSSSQLKVESLLHYLKVPSSAS